jgi:hypothetical protein
MRLFGWDCVGRDGIHPCEGGWSPEPQLWRLALSQQQPQPAQNQQKQAAQNQQQALKQQQAREAKESQKKVTI